VARGVPLARIAGIRITLDPSWFLIFLLVAWSLASGYLPGQLPDTASTLRWILALGLSAALFASVLAHEYSHALTARTRQVVVDEITLFIFGGVAKLKSEPRDAASEFLIAAAGPVLSVTLGGALLALRSALGEVAPEPVDVGLWWLGMINVALALFNLVPGFPLDGGRILRAILWWRTGDFDRATIGAARTGKVFAGLLIGGGVLLTLFTGNMSWLWEVLIGWFLWSAAAQSIRLARLREAVEGVTVREFLTERVPAIRADHDVRVGLAQAAASSETGELAVIERDGQLVGVVEIDELEEAASRTPERPAREIAREPDDSQIASPDESASDLITRLAGLGGRLLLVVEDGELLGTVDPRTLLSRTAGEGAGPGPAG